MKKKNLHYSEPKTEDGFVVYEKTISYSNIIPINEDYAKRTVGDYDVQKYMELWGDEVEEA